MNEFLKLHRVMIVGILAAILMPVYDLVSKGETSVRVLAFSAVIALASFLARNLRGQIATMAGIIGTSLATLATELQSGKPISWAQLILQVIVLLLAAVAPPAKSIGYERTDTIEAAKTAGEKKEPTLVGEGKTPEKP